MYMLDISLPFKGINGRNHSYLRIFERQDPFLEVYDSLVVYFPINPWKRMIGVCVINNVNDLKVNICSQAFDLHGYLGQPTNW